MIQTLMKEKKMNSWTDRLVLVVKAIVWRCVEGRWRWSRTRQAAERVDGGKRRKKERGKIDDILVRFFGHAIRGIVK
jgi:hypothetical protein